MKEIIERQRLFFEGGATRCLSWRIEKLRQFKEAVSVYEERIYEALWKDLHKSAYETYLTEVSLLLQEIELYIRRLKRWARPERVGTPLTLFGSKSRIVKEPLGVVLIMSPWNYPVQLLLVPFVGALAAGNCVVLKPSPYVPHVAAVMEELIASVFDPEHVILLQGDRGVLNQLLEERFDALFFTGSPEQGKAVMQAAARYLTPVTLELGGKSPCIVDKKADIELAARRIAWGKCLNAGQTCIAPDYLWVHTDVKQKLIERMIWNIRRFYGERPFDSRDYPRIVNKAAFDRLCTLLKDGDILFGGECDRENLYMAPTLLENVKEETSLMQQEIFGPLLPIFEFQHLEEAIRYINRHEKPLALYYFGTVADADSVMAETSSGGVCVNDTIMHIVNEKLPFGGVGNSGMGRYHGKESFSVFSNRRSVLYAATAWDIPLRYPPYRALKILKKMLGFRAVGW